MSFNMTLSECADALKATLVGESLDVSGISIDTRTLSDGELYVAIRGERLDGHTFVSDAEKAGAAAVLVDTPVETSLPQIQVENTQIALGELASYWARQFRIPTVAITGSNGKTTVKEMIATTLRQLGPVLSTKGNLNNEIGVPLTLLRMRKEHMYAVIEMGASHAGEISRLVAMARPDVAIVNNVGTAHLEGFGSSDGVAKAKSEIYAGLSSDGYAVINADDAYAEFMRAAAAHCHRREFAMHADVEVKGESAEQFRVHSIGATVAPRLRLSGEHNHMNALAAVAALQCLDIPMPDIVRGLELVEAVPGRLEKKPGVNGSMIIDDSYNANPESTRSAMRVLSKCSGKRFLVLGDMAELGSDAQELHQAMGESAYEYGFEGFWTVGPLAAAARRVFGKLAGSEPAYVGSHCADQEMLIKALKPLLDPDVTVLIKGSRSSRMERVVEGLRSTNKEAESASVAGPGS